MVANELGSGVTHAMFAAEGTGAAWAITIDEVRAGCARFQRTLGPP
jgi:predicted aspartyl protease